MWTELNFSIMTVTSFQDCSTLRFAPGVNQRALIWQQEEQMLKYNPSQLVRSLDAKVWISDKKYVFIGLAENNCKSLIQVYLTKTSSVTFAV